MGPSAQLDGRMDAVSPTRPAQGSGLTIPGTGLPVAGRHRGQPIGESPGRWPSSRRERGNELNTDPPRVPLASPHGDGVGHRGAEADRATPFPPVKRTCFPMHRGPAPRRRMRGLPPLPRWSTVITQGVYPGRDPRYPVGGAAIPVGGDDGDQVWLSQASVSTEKLPIGVNTGRGGGVGPVKYRVW